MAIKDLAKNYFTDLFNQKSSVYGPVIEAIGLRISHEDNTGLTAPFYIEEFKTALGHMDPGKSPGPDGLNSAFYSRFWDLYGPK